MEPQHISIPSGPPAHALAVARTKAYGRRRGEDYPGHERAGEVRVQLQHMKRRLSLVIKQACPCPLGTYFFY